MSRNQSRKGSLTRSEKRLAYKLLHRYLTQKRHRGSEPMTITDLWERTMIGHMGTIASFFSHDPFEPDSPIPHQSTLEQLCCAEMGGMTVRQLLDEHAKNPLRVRWGSEVVECKTLIQELCDHPTHVTKVLAEGIFINAFEGVVVPHGFDLHFLCSCPEKQNLKESASFYGVAVEQVRRVISKAEEVAVHLQASRQNCEVDSKEEVDGLSQLWVLYSEGKGSRFRLMDGRNGLLDSQPTEVIVTHDITAEDVNQLLIQWRQCTQKMKIADQPLGTTIQRKS